MVNQIKKYAETPVRRNAGSLVIVIKRLLYLEVIFKLIREPSISIYFISKYFKPYGFVYRKIFLTFLCLKFVLFDPFSYTPVKAQENINLNLVKLQSNPVSFNTLLLPTTISISSSPVSFKLSNLASAIKLSSNPVSLKTSLLPSTLTLSSKPVSYSLSKTADLIKLSSLPVSYLLDSFSGELIKLSSAQVSYKTFNGIPILDKVSPNVLPISQNGSTIDVSLGGENFVADAVATIGTLKIQTKYISSNELTATIPASYLEKENSFELFIANPPPEGGVSKGFNVMVVDPIPIAKINAAPNIGVAPQIVTFDGTETEDLLAKYFGQKLSYSWNFGDTEDVSAYGSNGVSAIDKNTSTNATTTHKYEKPGKYLVTLNVVNAYGKTSSTTKEIEIRDKNEAPNGTFETNLTSGDVPLGITFTSMITDKENDGITYLWDFGDGNSSEEANPIHNYTTADTYTPKLTVTDTLGAKTTIRGTKLTLLPPNNLPIAKVAAVPSEAILKENKEGYFRSTVQFVSAGTYDPDGEKLTYLWNFGDENESNEVNPKHEYEDAGVYNAKLSVQDPRGGKDEKEITVTISKPPPVIISTLSETTGNAPFEVSFDGTASHDFDGKEVALTFNFGDGTSEIVKSTNSSIMHVYQDPGTYLVTLTATASDGRTKQVNPANIIVGPSQGVVGKISIIEGNVKGTLGEAKVKLSSIGSYDPNDANFDLKYKWSWSARTWDTNGNLADISKEINEELEQKIAEVPNNKEIFDYIFGQAGQFTPQLEIEKSDGTKSKFFGETITITPHQAPVATAKIISEKSEGAPGLEVSFDGSGSYDPKAGGGLKILTWDFGDGEKSTEVSPKHIFNQEGTYTPTLVVVDNQGLFGFAQTNSIKITKSPEAKENNLLSRKILFQEAPTSQEENELTEKEAEVLVDSMIKEAANLFNSGDNQKPEIGPITLEPETVTGGGTVKLSAFIRDDIALSSFSYSLIDNNGNVITQKSIDLINKDTDKVLKEEYYQEEEITIPKDLLAGKYKLKLTATDTSGNQIATVTKEEDTNGEEISVQIEVTNNKPVDNDISPTADTIIEPDEVKEVIDTSGSVSEREITGVKETKEKEYDSITINEKYRGAHLAYKNILIGDIDILPGEAPANLIRFRSKEANIKLQTTEFQVTDVSSALNPYISFSPSTNSSLQLTLLSSKDGEIEIGTRGSLEKKYFAKWTETKVYVDHKYVGTILWLFGAKINFTSNVPSRVTYVQFRPVSRTGGELPPSTWAGNNFIFTKALPPPEITSIIPKETIAGRGSFDLTVSGSNFDNSSKIYFNGSQISPFISSETYLVARIPANFVKDIGIRSVSVRNSNGKSSNIVYHTSKANTNNPCSLSKTLPQRYRAGYNSTILSGNDAFVDGEDAVIKGNGSVIVPFCLDDDYEVKTSLSLTHIPQYSNRCNNTSFRIDGTPVGQKIYCGSGIFTFSNLNNSLLLKGLHNLEVSFSSDDSDRLVIGEATFSNGGGPDLHTITPTSVSLEGTSRTLKITGNNFDENTNVYLDDKAASIKSSKEKEIEIYLPDKFDTPGTKNIYLIGKGKKSKITSLNVRDRLELQSGSFMITPPQPFPGNNFDIELSLSDKLPESATGIYNAHAGIIDPDGNLLKISNFSNNFSTITIQGIKQPNGTVTFKGKIPLAIDSKPGNYKAFVSVVRDSLLGLDYSDFETYKYLIAKGLGLSADENLIPASHRFTFTPKPAVVIELGIEENDLNNVGFVRTANKVIQDSQSIKYKAEITRGKEHLSNIRFNFKSGDGRETSLTSENNTTFVYENKDLASTTPKNYYPVLEVFWIEGGTQTKIGTQNGPNLYVYPNYKPVAKARVFSEEYDTYTTTPPLFTAFIDEGSYDPNQRFSRAVDFVDSKDNLWGLYKGITGPDEVPLSPPIGSKKSEDGKTFFSGNLFTPGTYFARLTVRDQTGQVDSSNTESVTVTKPSQKVIVFATTDPKDKKVYDPNNETATGQDGIPVKFMSEVTVLGGAPTLSYLWDFGDGSCVSAYRSDGVPANEDCTSPNPTHYYFDSKRSFGGMAFVDRKSVTPKLTVSAMFAGGKKEVWESSAGTITFNGEPNFVLLDIKGEPTEGIVPLTVNFMIDPASAKAVNATITKYEIDYGDSVIASGSEAIPIESGVITFDELLNKTFTHTYLVPNTYSPVLKVYVSESKREFVFSIPKITASGTGVGGVYLLDDLSTISSTNQPIVTFMILAVFPNPIDSNNSLKIVVKDKEGNETITELDPDSQNQTISLSEGENSYYFLASDSSAHEWKSEVRTIILDAKRPLVEIILPNENEILLNNKLVISGVVEDENFASVAYRINSSQEFKIIDSAEIEDVGNKKAFDLVFDEPVSKLELIAKDKAGNETVEIVEINSGRVITLKQKALNKTEQVKIVKNNQQAVQIKQGELFALIGDLIVCDDTQKSQNDGQAKLVINTNNFMINSFPSFINIRGGLLGSGLITTATLGKLDGCREYENIFESVILNNNNSINELFNPSVAGNNPALFWSLGTYTITQTLSIDLNNVDLYGTTFSNNSQSTTLTYNIEITRNALANIKKVEPKNLVYNQENTTTFKLITQDSIPFTNDRKPEILKEAAYIETPSGIKESNLNLTCNVPQDQLLPSRNLKYDCTLIYTPKEYTKEDKPYILNIPVEFPEENGDKPQVTANAELRSDFEVGAIIIDPLKFTVIQSGSEEIKAEAFLSNFPEELKDSPEKKFKRLAKYGISLPNSKTYTGKRPIATGANDAVLVKGINPTEDKIGFSTKINFNLINNESTDPVFDFKNDFLNRTAFGPAYLYTVIASSNLNETTFSYGQPQEFILLDKPRINDGGKLKKKIDKKTGEETKELRLTISDNTKLPEKYALEVKVEAYDLNNNLLTTQTKLLKIINESLSNNITIKDLLKETEKAVVSLYRNDNFLNEIEERVKEEFNQTAADKLNNPEYKIADKREYAVDGEILTFCEAELQDTNILFSYSQKSGKIPGLSAEGTLTTDLATEPTTIPILNLQEIIDPTNRLFGSMSRTVSFPMPSEWNNFSSVTFTIKSGGESDSCNLVIGSKAAFEIGDADDKVATVDDKSISVKDLNQLLFDLGYLTDPNQGKYTESTRDAFAKLVCDYNSTKESLSNLRFQTYEGRCEENVFPDFKAGQEEVKISTVLQDFMRGIYESNLELHNEIKNNPILATFVIGFAVAAGVIITAGSAGTDTYILGVLAELGIVGGLTQLEDIKNKLAGYFSESDSFKAGYVFGEVGKFVGLAIVIGFASKGLTNLSYTIQGIKQAQILSEQGHKDLANAIYEQVSRINNAADDVKIGMQKGLDGVLKTVDDIQTGEILKDFTRLWTEVTQEEISSIKLSALKLFNDIVAKMQQQEELFKIYETDPGGYETGKIRNITYDQNLKEAVERLNLDLPKEVANTISAKVNGLVSDLTQKFVSDGFTLIGRTISKDQVPQRLSTVMKVSDLRYLLKGTKFESETNEDVILAAIKSEEIVIEKLVGEISGKSKLRWWTDSAKLDELKQTGKYTKEFINGDEGLALDYDLAESKALIRIDIDTNNLPDKFFHIPISTEGGYKFVPSTYNLLNRSGKTKGDFLELTSPPVNADKASGYVIWFDVIN